MACWRHALVQHWATPSMTNTEKTSPSEKPQLLPPRESWTRPERLRWTLCPCSRLHDPCPLRLHLCIAFSHFGHSVSTRSPSPATRAREGPFSKENAIASRLEAIASRLEARLEAIASRLEAIATRLEAIARRLEAIASRLEAMAIRLEAITSN